MKKLLLGGLGLVIGAQILGAECGTLHRRVACIDCKQSSSLLGGVQSGTKTTEVGDIPASLLVKSLMTKIIADMSGVIKAGCEILKDSCTKVEYGPKCEAAQFNVTAPGPNAPTFKDTTTSNCHNQDAHQSVFKVGFCDDRP